MKKKLPINFLVFLAGLGLLSAGVFLIYPPAALIVAGLVLMLISLFGEGNHDISG